MGVFKRERSRLECTERFTCGVQPISRIPTRTSSEILPAVRSVLLLLRTASVRLIRTGACYAYIYPLLPFPPTSEAGVHESGTLLVNFGRGSVVFLISRS